VTERRTAKDFAELLPWLVEELHGEARKGVVMTDNLNTHTPGCLNEAFDRVRARRIAEKLERHQLDPQTRPLAEQGGAN
jgi:hypothetical protein